MNTNTRPSLWPMLISGIDAKFYGAIRKIQVGKSSSRALIWITRAGDGFIWIPVTAFFIYSNPKEWQNKLSAILLCTGISVFLYLIIKNIVKRPRPFVGDGKIEAEVPPLDKYSFPSGHLMNNLATSLMLSVYMQKTGIAMALLSLFWSLLRIYFGVHYLTDILGGIVFAFFCFIISLWLHAFFFPI